MTRVRLVLVLALVCVRLFRVCPDRAGPPTADRRLAAQRGANARRQRGRRPGLGRRGGGQRDFRQTTPDEGQPASEQTDVRIGVHEGHALHRRGLLRPDAVGDHRVRSRRDAPLDDSDSFRVILDTFRDQQNGFVFGTNPNALEYDGQVTNEGQGGSIVLGGAQARIRRRLQPELGRVVDGAHVGDRDRLERGVCDPLSHAALPVRRRAGVGHQLPAHDPPAQRGRLLVAAAAPVHAVPAVAGRHGRRARRFRRSAT